MSEKCPACGRNDCTCDGDYREAYHHMTRYWNRAEIDRVFTHLNAEPKTLSDGIDPPAEIPPRREINVHGREEHEALLRDPAKCAELGLDIYYERMVYLKRWGGWFGTGKRSFE